MKLGLEKFSYRSGSLRLKLRPAIEQEIDDVLSKPKVDISTLSRDQFTEILREDFVARGWENQPSVLRRRGERVPLMDLRKETVGIQLGIRSFSLIPDLLKFQAAYESQSAKIDVGVYIAGTTAFQRRLRKETEKPWAGSSFHAAVRNLPALNGVVEMPICIIGLEVIEVDERKRTFDLTKMSPSQLKEFVFAFLEKKYGRPIDQNVRVMGRGTDIEFDGILRLDDMDVILEIELSRTGGILPSKILSDSIRSFTKRVREYQNLTGRKASLRFILLGKFSSAYLRDVLAQRDDGYGGAEEIDVDYELYSFEELGISDR